ncbi:hypothetical protein ON010_g7922 [Phytophthora cinnamomi]|nr:hypothetical protein ON010_g7922 [Phytophthora cinnamomi]
MLPNFASLAQREQKRIYLLERTKLRVRQKDAARHMHSEAPWASDVGKIISVDKRATHDSNDHAGDGVHIPSSKPDIGIETSENAIIRDSKERIASRNWIRAFFKASPNWTSVKKNGSDNENLVTWENGSLRTVSNGKKIRRYGTIDWVATEAKVRDILYDGESNSIGEIGAMRAEDKPPRHDLKYLNKSTSTKLDDDDAKYKLTWFIIDNKNLPLANNLQKRIIPILKDGNAFGGGYLWIDDHFRIYVIGIDSNKHRPAAQENVNWILTLERFLLLAIEPAEDLIDDRAGVKTGKDEYMDKDFAIPELEAKTMLIEYYQ